MTVVVNLARDLTHVVGKPGLAARSVVATLDVGDADGHRAPASVGAPSPVELRVIVDEPAFLVVLSL